MGPCTTVALRYYFVFDDEDAELKFVPHMVIKLETCNEPCDDSEDIIKPESVIYEDDVEYLRSLDPKEWKSQDHYKVLGIETLRYKATDEIIKTAYRKKVLKHHPDKRKALGEEIRPDDDYFTCITMAYETLSNTSRRRAYDSVDPLFDNNLPSLSDIKKDFFKPCSYYFDLNSRWSENRNVPKLGDENSSRDSVEQFYSFWYNFKSWREYSYEDEEDKEKCQDRDERRYVEKLNKAERIRKKKEEMSRIRSLVDFAYNNDPRIAKFKADDKEKKLAAKKAKQSAIQAKKEEEERILKEIQLAKERAEAAERARLETKRQEREALKKILKKERKALRDFCKSNSYFSENEEQNLKYMTAVETMCENLSLSQLEELNENLKNNGKEAFLKAIRHQEQQLEKERESVIQATKQKTEETRNGSALKVLPEWNTDNMQLLVKAVNLFPAGTSQRWEVVANFINQHGTFKNDSTKFTSKLVLSKAKDLQNADFAKNNLKEVANKQAYDNYGRKNKPSAPSINEESITKNFESTNATMNGNNSSEPNSSEDKVAVWTATEQQLLEQALKTYPASTPQRWDRIAECIPSRSKKDCMKRYKELVEAVKAKKAAQATISK